MSSGLPRVTDDRAPLTGPEQAAFGPTEPTKHHKKGASRLPITCQQASIRGQSKYNLYASYNANHCFMGIYHQDPPICLITSVKLRVEHKTSRTKTPAQSSTTHLLRATIGIITSHLQMSAAAVHRRHKKPHRSLIPPLSGNAGRRLPRSIV